MKQEQVEKGKTLLGVGEYGAWKCTLLPRVDDATGDLIEAENLWVFARNLKEIAENVAGVESAVFLGKATCIADSMTSGVTEQVQAPALTSAVKDATIINPLTKLKICPFCASANNEENFTKPETVTANVDIVACPHCHMLINRSRLIDLHPAENK